MGLVQRIIEAGGIPTVSITLSLEITRRIKPPRAVYTGLPLGHPLGYPGQRFRRLQILRLLLKAAEEIQTPGTLLEMDLRADGEPDVVCMTCGV